MFQVIQIGFVILFPGLILYLERRTKIVQILSPIVICYALGIVLANIPNLDLNRLIFKEISEISISLAIPLLLFNSNVLDWISHAGKSILSYMLSVLAVIISSVIYFHFYKNTVPEAWQISGMLIGVYTGGTPNMSAIGMAFNTPQEIFILLNSSDVILGSVYFICIITFIRKFLSLFLPRYKSLEGKIQHDEDKDRDSITIKQWIINVVIMLLLSSIILGLAIWISITVKGEIKGPWVILVLTTLGIGFSFITKIRKMKGSYQTAYYLLLIFSLAIGALADVSELLKQSSDLFLYTAFVMFTAIIIHYILAAFFRIDHDTVIITSTAAIYGPAFIGPVANAIKNKEVIVPGIAMGLLGYAIGNYIGIAIGMLLH